MDVDVLPATELGSHSHREDPAQQRAEQPQQLQPSEAAELLEPAARAPTANAMMQLALAAAGSPGHRHAQSMRPLPVSPSAMTQPFSALLGSADKQRREVHRAAAVQSGFVYMLGVGLVPVVQPGELAVCPQGAAFHQAGLQSFGGRLEALVVPANDAVAVSANVAGALQAAAPPAPSQPSQPGLPHLKVLRTVQQFWKLWADGDVLTGQAPLRDLPPAIVAKKKQRYSEWRKAAQVIANRVAAMPSSSAGPSPTALPRVLEQLERERDAKKESMPTFIKALGKELKSAAGAE